MNEIQIDDLDLDKLAAWRAGVRKNPIVATEIDNHGNKKATRLRALPKPLRRKIRKLMSNAVRLP